MTKIAKKYAVMNRKGGVGKTTTTVTVAFGLAQKLGSNGNVLIVDLDPQGNVASSLRLVPREATMADLLLGDADIADCIVPVGERRPNLFVIPADDSLADAKVDLMADEVANDFKARLGSKRRKSSRPLIKELLEHRLAKADQAFDYILIDCPPSLDMLAEAVYQFSDAAIVPVKPDYLGTTGTRQHTEEIVRMQSEGIKISIEWLLPTFFRNREILARQMLESLVRRYGANRVAVPIPQAASVEQAPAAGGMTILEYDPESPAAKAYDHFIGRIYAKATV